MAKSTNEVPVSLRDFANMHGIPYSQVYRASKTNFFSTCSTVDAKTGKVWLYPEAAKRFWDEHRDHEKTANLAKGAAAINSRPGRKPRGAAVPPESVRPETGDPVESMAALKAQALRLKIQSDALDFQRKRGALVDKQKVYAGLFEIGKEIRLALLSIPDRVVDAMVAAPNRTEAHNILTREIHEMLERISDRISADIIKPDR